MPRQKKDWKALNVKLDASLYDQFAAYCEDLGQTKTTALERILKSTINKHEEQKEAFNGK